MRRPAIPTYGVDSSFNARSGPTGTEVQYSSRFQCLKLPPSLTLAASRMTAQHRGAREDGISSDGLHTFEVADTSTERLRQELLHIGEGRGDRNGGRYRAFRRSDGRGG